MDYAIPKNETSWCHCVSFAGDEYIITSKTLNRDLYFLYKISGEKAKKIKQSKNPTNFDKIIFG